MDVQDIWDNILTFTKEVFAPFLFSDAEAFGYELTYKIRASIEDYSILTLIWAADVAARKQGHSSVAESLLRQFEERGMYMERISKEKGVEPPPYSAPCNKNVICGISTDS